MSRDPRIDPAPGDRIQQPKGGDVITVLSVGRNWVTWRATSPAGKVYRRENGWSLQKWRATVAKDADILEVGEP